MVLFAQLLLAACSAQLFAACFHAVCVQQTSARVCVLGVCLHAEANERLLTHFVLTSFAYDGVIFSTMV